MSRLIGTIAILVFVLLLILTAAVFGPGAAGADTSPSPSPSPSVTAEPEPEQASAALVRRALRMRDRAKVQRRKLARVRACFDARGPVRLYPKPKTRTAEAWQKALRRWTHQRDDWKAKVKAGRAKMRDPGGSGWERWRPLVRWTWPAHCVDTVIRIMRYESGGRPRVLYGNVKLPKSAGKGKRDPRAGGLMQLKPAPDGWADPEFNLRYAYERKYLPALRMWGNGWLPWAGCRAF